MRKIASTTTRAVLFPEFEGGYEGDVSPVLKEEFGVEKLFDRKQSDLSALTGKTGGVYCTEAQHIATLKVDKKGIEGAAVFVLPGAGEAGPDEYEAVYEDFLVDRAFGVRARRQLRHDAVCGGHP